MRDLFAKQGTLLKKIGVSQVLANVSDDFHARYAAIFTITLHRNAEICGERVRNAFYKRYPDEEPHHPNAWSALFRSNKQRAIEAGQMTHPIRHEKSTRPSSHASNKPIYKSLVYKK
jgi:hypothetical protein